MGNEAKQGKVVCSIKNLNPSTATEKVKCVVASQPITNAIVIPEFNEIVVLTASETKSLKESVEKYDQYIKDIQQSYASKDAKTIGDAKNKLAEFMAAEAKKSAKTITKITDKSVPTNNDKIIDKFIEIIELDSNKYSYAPLDLIASFRRSGTQKALDLKNLKSIKKITSGSAGVITKTAEKADSSTTLTNGDAPTVVDPNTRESRVNDRYKSVSIKANLSHDWLGPENKPYETQVKMEAILKFVGVGEGDIAKKSLEWAKTFDAWVEKTNGELKWTMQDRDIRRKKLVTLLDPKSTPAQRGIAELKDQTILTALQEDVDNVWGVYLTEPEYERTSTRNYDLGGIKSFIQEIENLTWNTYAINAATLQRNCEKWAKYIDIWLTPTQRDQELNSASGKVSYDGVDYQKKTALAEKLRAKAEDIQVAVKKADEKEKNSKKENGAIFEDEALGRVKNEIEYIWDDFDNDFVTKINKIKWSEFSGPGDDAVLVNSRMKLLGQIKDKQLPPYNFNISASAQFMRFTAGKSVVSNFDPAKGRIGLKAEAKVDLALAEGKSNVQFFMPDDQGADLSFESTGKYDVIEWQKTDTVYAKFNTFSVDKVFLLPITMSMLSEAMKRASWQTRLVNKNTAAHAIQVIGHTDPDGGAEYNMDLSIRRAKVAYEFLTFQYDAWYHRFIDGTWGDREILAMVKDISGSSKKGRLQDNYWSDIINKKLHSIVNSKKYTNVIDYIGYQVNCELVQPKAKSKPSSSTSKKPKTINRLGTNTLSEKAYLKQLIKAYMRKGSGDQFLLKTSFMEQAYDGRGLTELKSTSRANYKENRRVEVHLNKSVNTTTKEVTKKIPFGHIRIQIEAYITGYAGANAAASAELGFGSAKGESKVLGVSSGNAAVVEEQAQPQGMRGSTTNTQSNTASTRSASYGTEGQDVDGLDLQLGGFAGASATPGIKGILEWKCPKPDLTIESSSGDTPELVCSADNKEAAKVIKVAGLKNQFAELASIGLSVTGSAGIGFAGEFKLGFDTDTGKFLFKVKIGVTCGLGAGGGLEFAVGVKNVYWLVRFIHAQLNDHNFNFLDFFVDDAYKYYSAWSFELYKNGFDIAGDVVENIGEAALFGGIVLRDIRTWWDKYETSIEVAEALTKQIEKDNALLTYMSPDVKARIIDNLCVDGWFSADVAQEKAIIKVLNTLKSKKEFNEILERMSGELPNIGDPYEGAFVTKESRQNIKAKRIINNKKKLLEMLDGSRHEQFITLQKSLPDEAPKMTKA